MHSSSFRALLLVTFVAVGAGCVREDPGEDSASSSADDLSAKACKSGHSKACDAGADAPVMLDAAPPPVCASFTYSAYGACQPNGTQTRTVTSATPEGCAGGEPVLTQTCTYVPPPPSTCTTFTYSDFGACQPDGTQTRTVLSSLPEGCTGGSPVLVQKCTYVAPVVMCTSFTYSAYGACQPNNTQTRTVVSSSPAGCTGGSPVLTQACTYVPPTCTSFVYSAFGACQPDNTQTRTVISASPAGCMGGAPVLSQACTYVPPGPRDYKSFDGSSLTANRTVSVLGVDRKRVKPYSALKTEYPRVLGNIPASLAPASATFGAPPTRWYEEPQASAVALQTSLDVAFDGCLTYTATATRYGVAPTASSALTECTAMARKFWSRTPLPEDVQACVTVATTGTTAEPDARRRWAYACTSLLTSTGFLTY